jgi:predicted NAD/FAD-dependent oxidoreductase
MEEKDFQRIGQMVSEIVDAKLEQHKKEVFEKFGKGSAGRCCGTRRKEIGFFDNTITLIKVKRPGFARAFFCPKMTKG